ADDGAPAMGHQDELALTVAFAYVFGDFDGIVDVAVDVDAVGVSVRILRGVGFSGRPLVPVDDGEVFFDGALELPERWNQRRRRAAMDEQYDGIAFVLAAHIDPLVDAADPRRIGFLDAVRRDDMSQILDNGARLGVGGRVLAFVGDRRRAKG